MSFCTHPPREWFRGQLLPCATPSCADGCGGKTWNIPVDEPGRGFRLKVFERHRKTVDGAHGEVDSWSWELSK